MNAKDEVREGEFREGDEVEVLPFESWAQQSPRVLHHYGKRFVIAEFDEYTTPRSACPSASEWTTIGFSNWPVCALRRVPAAKGEEKAVTPLYGADCEFCHGSGNEGPHTVCHVCNGNGIQPERSETREEKAEPTIATSDSHALATNLRRLAGTERTPADQRMYEEMDARRLAKRAAEVSRDLDLKDLAKLEAIEHDYRQWGDTVRTHYKRLTGGAR